jgi:dGTPase
MPLERYAQHDASTRGRRHPEGEHAYRSPYQRDRDRIIHCRAFRRLEYKTQVFVNHEGDHYRTRLTHSLEVAQIGRTVARALGLNEDLVESLALSHDLGHTPFGHLGEEVLDEVLRGEGGFNHNRQTLRIVDVLENRYPAIPGLNLTWEVREGIAKHSGPIDVAKAPEFAEFEPGLEPPLEAQMIDLVDEIAYNHHDVDDGLESGLLDLDDLVASVPLFAVPFRSAVERHGGAAPESVRATALRGMIDTLVSDLVETTRGRVRASGVACVDDVRRHGAPLVGLSTPVAEANRTLKGYLRERLYRHPHIERSKDKARRVLRALVDRYLDNPLVLPGDTRHRGEAIGLRRAVADYVAGMTDRYAIQEYQRLFDPALPV